MEKVLEIQRQTKENVKTRESYIADLKNWEAEMKRKEAALNGQFEQDLPPVRSKIRKEKPAIAPQKPEKRISAADYKAWEQFDADKACENIDMEAVGPTSLDSKKSQIAKQEKLREEAQYEKERGNSFVKQEKWDDAISCYTRAIELYKDDAIYYANRGLCYLKKESLHLAETDCTKALKLDPTYVKALQRRATAREKLGSLRGASSDLAEVMRLEPNNAAAGRQLQAIKARMGTKGTKSKSSPATTPTMEIKTIVGSKAKIIELEDSLPEVIEKQKIKVPSVLDNWVNGLDGNVTIIKPVRKPPHLRSKRALKPVHIEEIPLGKVDTAKPPTRMKIVEIVGDTAAAEKEGGKLGILENREKGDCDMSSPKINGQHSPESQKLMKDFLTKEVLVQNLVPPVSSVQFMTEWKNLKDKGEARFDYLQLIEPSNIPSIFHNALESEILSDVLHVLEANSQKFKQKKITDYLKGLCNVKRFGALSMFLSSEDKLRVKNLLEHCRSVEGCPDQEISELKSKFEI